MEIHIQLHYHTDYGQQLFVSGSTETLGQWDPDKALPMSYGPGDIWDVQFEKQEGHTHWEYKFLMKDDSGNVVWEWGDNHKFEISNISDFVSINDYWRNPPAEDKALLTAAFTDVIMKPGLNKSEVKNIDAKKILQFKMEVPRIGSRYKVCVLGNKKSLGNWNPSKALTLDCGDNFPFWSGQLDVSKLKLPLEYKYGIWDIEKKEAVTIEEGKNRVIPELPSKRSSFIFLQADNNFRYPLGSWKGAGVAVPVFSLRSKDSFGVGDFNDLKGIIDWADGVGMKMVQILPVNETIASHNWLDSYPYKAISVMALHPIYIHLPKMGKLKDSAQVKEFEKKKKELNKAEHVDYPDVLKLKSRFYKLLYDQEGEELFKTEDFKLFFSENKEWLVPYAAFVYLRDKMKSPDFRKWTKYSAYKKEEIQKLSQPDNEAWHDIAVHYFIQYHLDKQLKEAADYARSKGIILKGDIPIGISPNSVEAWTEPHLFNLDSQAGAPPDDFAVKGQNWGFPTYNWDEMAKDGYMWWIKRMMKMSEYFDTYRIDHILGFFRIWEVPQHAVEAILGYFNPALTMSAGEIESYGIPFDYERFTQPYIREHMLAPLFGEKTVHVIQNYLENSGHGTYRLKQEFNCQKKINNHFLQGIEEEDLSDENRRIRDGLFDLAANVLFIQTGHNEWHPRISIQNTNSFQELDHDTKNKLYDLYIQYFYKRHEDFWYRSGMHKLPTISSVGNLLVCGEDLGMIPDCVPRAMDELGILSLEIQRMPKDPKKEYAHPADAPYLSVCTTSTHDMPTIRGWWEEDHAKTQKFYNEQLGNLGEAPYFAEPWICRQILTQHFYSPAMWVTIPIQDLISIDGDFRWDETHNEQINHPSNVRHKWRFRMKQSIEELKNNEKLNSEIRELITQTGRNSDY